MQAGERITPKIKLVRPLGQGAMGFVWEAQHQGLGAKVAVKLMSPAYQDDARFSERFRQEARAAAQLSSPHVVKVLEHGVAEGGEPYIVMELLEGETLRSRLERVGALPLADVVTIVRQTTQALTAAHGAGVVHRDIKPDNMFLTEGPAKPFVKVLDFGIAKLAQPEGVDMTTTGRTLGTPLYMSPEQFVSTKRVDHRADLWSLGVVAHHAMAGRLPFEGETLGALALAVHAGEFKRPSAVRRGLPEAVDGWMARALQRDPAQRFQSAAEMAATLVKAAGEINVSPDPARRAPPAGRRVRPRDDAVPKRRSSAPARAPEPQPVEEAAETLRAELQLGRGRVEIAESIPSNAWNVTTEAVVCPWFGSRTTFEGRDMLRMAGSQLRDEMRGAFVTTFQWELAPFEVRHTSAGALPLPLRRIIHIGMSEARPVGSAQQLSDVLSVAEDCGVKSLACLPWYLRTPGFESEPVAGLALDIAIKYMLSPGSVAHIVFVPFNSLDREVWIRILNTMAEAHR